MVEERLADGRRVAELFASEVTGDPDVTATVREADPDVEPSPDGRLAYAVVAEDADGTRAAEVYVHPERARVEFLVGRAAAAAAADDAGLRVRPKAVDPPRTLVFLVDGVDAKRGTAVLRAALDAAGEER
jgi:hypothetical protein